MRSTYALCYRNHMICVVIPTLNSQKHLPACLSALVPGAVDGLIKKVLIVDGGSSDETLKIADAAGADIVKSKPGRGIQLAAGGAKAECDWLLFLHSDTVLQPPWQTDVAAFVENGGSDTAAAFRFGLNDERTRARILEKIVSLRCRLFGLPYGDQGLLISKKLYNELGGFLPIVLMEDVDLVRKIGAKQLHMLNASAVTSADKYRQKGYLRRMLGNIRCLAMWFAGVDPAKILEKYR